MMQDALLCICKQSVKEFEEFILKFIPTSTEVLSSSEVHNTFIHPKIAEEEDKEGEKEKKNEDESENQSEDNEEAEPPKDPFPLFVLELVLKPGQELPQYSTDPKEVVSTIIELFQQGIKTLQEIPQLEPILLKHMFLKNTHGNK
jgi:hypothetical protein